MNKYGGLIDFLSLNDWWNKISEDDKYFIRSCSIDFKDIDNPQTTVFHFSQTASTFLTNIASWVISAKKYDLAIEILNEALDRSPSKTDLHFIHTNFADLYYKRRNENDDWLNKCIEYCKKDIENFPSLRSTYIENQRKFLTKSADSKFNSLEEKEQLLAEAANPIFDLRVPSFERLCIIYEKQKKYQEAIKVCELALSYGLTDKTQGGFQGRIERIKKKMKSS